MHPLILPAGEGLDTAVGVLQDGGVVAYPTETVYGLAVDPFSPGALDNLFRVKAREEGRPVLVVVANRSHLKALAASVSEAAERCMRAFWPGPLSLLFPPAPGLHEALIGPDGKVCVRETAHPAARALCLDWGGGLTSTSANLSGKPPAVAARGACLEGVSLVLDGGALPPSPPSTVFDPDTRAVLREGRITRRMLAEAGAL